MRKLFAKRSAAPLARRAARRAGGFVAAVGLAAALWVVPAGEGAIDTGATAAGDAAEGTGGVAELQGELGVDRDAEGAFVFERPHGFAEVAFAAEGDGEAPTVSIPGAEGNAAGNQGAGEGASDGSAAADGTAATDSGSDSADGNAAEGEGEAAAEGADGAEAQADGQSEAEAEEQPEEPEIDPNNRVNPQQMPDSSFLYDTSIAELADADPYMNNQTVQVVGEAIGDILDAVDGPSFAWVMLQEKVDNDYPQISVLMTRSQADLIDHLGRYGVQGTKLQVRGEFHLACPQHDGLTDLHAESVTVVARGSETPQTLDPQQFVPGAVLFLVAGVLLLAFRRLQEGQR